MSQDKFPRWLYWGVVNNFCCRQWLFFISRLSLFKTHAAFDRNSSTSSFSGELSPAVAHVMEI